MLHILNLLKRISHQLTLALLLVGLLGLAVLPGKTSSQSHLSAGTQRTVPLTITASDSGVAGERFSVNSKAISLNPTTQASSQTLTPTLFYDAGLQNAAFGEPVIDSQGNLLVLESVSCTNGCLRVYSISPAATKRWETSEFTADAFSSKSLILGLSDRVYVPNTRTTLQAFDSQGQPVAGWPFTIPSAPNWAFDGDPIVDKTDGTVYVSSSLTLSFSTFPNSIQALNPDGTQKWRRDYEDSGRSSAVARLIQGPQGDIYAFLFPRTNVHFVRVDRNSGSTVCDIPTTVGSDRVGGDTQGIFTDFLNGFAAFGENCTSQTIYTSPPDRQVEFRKYNQGKVFGIDYPVSPFDASQTRLLAVANDGTFLWRNPEILPSTSDNPIRVIKNGVLYVLGMHVTDSNKQKIFLVDALSGQILNSMETAPACSSCGVAVANDGTIYLNDRSSTKIYKLQGSGTPTPTPSPTPTSTPTPTPTPQKRPLIFIPGNPGSRLDEVLNNGNINVWPGPGGLDTYNFLPELTLDPSDGSRRFNVTDVMRRLPSGDDQYESFLNRLVSTDGGYVEYRVDGLPDRRNFACDTSQTNATLFLFPYDWRQSITKNSNPTTLSNVQLLRAYIQCIQQIHPGSSVDVVTHSTGGLIARRYILTHPTDNQVNKLITIAAPFLGAPKTIDVLETGAFLGEEAWKGLLGGVKRALFNERFKGLARYFPGVHELLPSRKYFDLTVLPPYNLNGKNLNYNDFAYQLNLQFNPSTPGTNSSNFHDTLLQDDWSDPHNPANILVKYFHLYGVNPWKHTIGQVQDRLETDCTPGGCTLTRSFTYEYVNGDGTVPLVSAARRARGQNLNAPNAQVFRPSALLSETSVEHTGLVKNVKVQNGVLCILAAQTDQQALACINKVVENSLTQSATNPQISEGKINADAEDEPPAQPAFYLRLRGTDQITLRDDSGNSITPFPSAQATGNGLPQVTINASGLTSSQFVIPTDQSYTLTLRAGAVPLSLELTLSGDTTTQAIRYKDLVLPINTQAKLRISSQGVEQLQSDGDSDGTFETPVTPTASVSGIAAQDTEPPTVSVSEARQQTGTLVTLGATDSGSGVKALHYSIDGTNYQPYTNPFNVDPYRNPVVYAFADDNVANRSSLTTFQLTAPASALQFSAGSYSANEGDGRATITVTRIGDTSGAATVDFQTVDDPAAVPCDPALKKPDGSSYPQGAAYARCDYATSIESVTFAAGDAGPKTITIPLIDDAYVEGAETVQLKLLNPAGATLSAQSSITLTITDNDSAIGANPIFSTPFFVRMHYLDFLSREPEPNEPWSAILNNCPNAFNLDARSPSAACDRLIVSQSFFGSPEFRLKGFYAFIFYRVAFNRRPTYEEIIPDMRSVSGATAEEVYQKRAALPVNFTGRSEFKGLYDALGNTAFVNALLDRYGLQAITSPDPANPEGGMKVILTRADLINRLSTSGAQLLTRAQVLRAVVESNEIGAAEYNQAFVAMQYYGYLRRTPEESGYQAWLRVINQDPNNIRIMVNGFMNSTEYRLRFGTP
jgi:pimeloyl-ACP methyl ester carboxylesterase